MAASDKHRGFYWNPDTQALEIKEQGVTFMIFEKGQHIKLESDADSKNVRINSRSYTQTSGDASGVQIKPNQTVSSVDPGTTDVSITGAEFSPRFAAGIAGGNLIAIKADPVLKGGSGGAIAGEIVGVQVNMDFGTSDSRVITGDVSAFEAFLAIPNGNTYSASVAVMRVRTVNIRAWDVFLNFDDANTGACTVSTTTITSGTNTTHRLKCLVGGTTFYLMGVAAA